MVDGQRYTSKAALRASYRREGYIEAGGEDIAKHYPKPKEPEAVRETIQRALERAGIN